MSELGYPPVQFGDWVLPRAAGYKMTAAHNTVVIDGANQPVKGLDPIAGHPPTDPSEPRKKAIR